MSAVCCVRRRSRRRARSAQRARSPPTSSRRSRTARSSASSRSRKRSGCRRSPTASSAARGGISISSGASTAPRSMSWTPASRSPASTTRTKACRSPASSAWPASHPMVEHFKFRAGAHQATPKITIPVAVARSTAGRRRRRSTRRSIRTIDDVLRRSRPGLPQGRARLRRRRLPLSAARRGVHRHAVRSEVPRADDGARRRSGQARRDLRRPHQCRDVGHSGRHDDHHASVPRQLQIDLHGRRRLRRRCRRSCSTRSTCTAISWNTTTSAPAGSSRCASLPKGKTVVLGLVTTKTGKLESKDELKRRIDEAAKFVDLDQLCLSGQCGFASTEEGNTLTEDEQWAKLRHDRRSRRRGLGLADCRLDDARRPSRTIREAVRALCADFPASTGARSTASAPIRPNSSQALTEAGFLAALIPEEYGGSGLTHAAAAAIMEEIHAAGCNGAACHAQMYTMGTLLRHGSEAQKARYLPAIAAGELRLQAFGVTEPTSGTDTLSLRTTAVRDGDHYVVNGQKIWTSRAEHSDLMLLLARTTPREQAQEAHRRALGVPRRHARGDGQGPDHPADPHDDEPRHHRDLLRRRARAGREPDRRGGQGLPLHPLRHECRAHPDRAPNASATPSGSSTRRPPMPRSASCSAARSGRTRACSFRSRAPMRRCARPS